jgi:dTMP kinase
MENGKWTMENMKYQLSLDIGFRQNPYRGFYVALEGVDGCGKTTQCDALAAYFAKLGSKAAKTSEPKFDLPGGDLIASVFKSELTMPAEAFQHLLTMNRLINQERVVEPALKHGEIVVSDRCMWSAVPYGLMDKGVKFSKSDTDRMLLAQSILSPYHQTIIPDLIFYIDINADVALARSLHKKGRREQDIYEKKEKLETVVRGYRWLVKQFSQEFVIIDGERPVEVITREIIKKMKAKSEK